MVNIRYTNIMRKPLQTVCLQGFSFGEPGGIRTHDLLIRSQTLYPAELRARVLINSA